MSRKEQPVHAPSCRECVYWYSQAADRGLCLRHAPSPTDEDTAVTIWPPTRATDRCGSSILVGSSDKHGLTECRACLWWRQDAGSTTTPPKHMRGLSPLWWQQSGRCARYAPGPGHGSGPKLTDWRVTHMSARCGDGDAVTLEEAPAGEEWEVEPVG